MGSKLSPGFATRFCYKPGHKKRPSSRNVSTDLSRLVGFTERDKSGAKPPYPHFSQPKPWFCPHDSPQLATRIECFSVMANAGRKVSIRLHISTFIDISGPKQAENAFFVQIFRQKPPKISGTAASTPPPLRIKRLQSATGTIKIRNKLGTYACLAEMSRWPTLEVYCPEKTQLWNLYATGRAF